MTSFRLVLNAMGTLFRKVVVDAAQEIAVEPGNRDLAQARPAPQVPGDEGGESSALAFGIGVPGCRLDKRQRGGTRALIVEQRERGPNGSFSVGCFWCIAWFSAGNGVREHLNTVALQPASAGRVGVSETEWSVL